MTHITDTSGVTRTYAPGGVSGAASSSGSHDATKRLVAIEQPDGTRYDVTTSRDLSSDQRQALESGKTRTVRYTDLAGNEVLLQLPDVDLGPFEERTGEEITIQHLSRRLLEDGTELNYRAGRLHEIRLPDARRLTDFTVDANGIPMRGILTLPDGSTKPLQNGALVEVTRPEDGVKLRYRNDQIAEIHVPINALRDVTVSRVGLNQQGQLDSGEVLLPSGDRLTLSGGRFTAATLADGTEIRSVSVTQDQVTGATLSVSGSQATLSNTRDVGVRLSSGQQYLYRYKTVSGTVAVPDTALESMTFRDDFEDGNSLGWSVVNGDWSVTGGDYRANDNEYAHIYSTTGLNWADYTVTTRFTYESFNGPAKEAQLLFRWQDANNFYMARVLDRSFQGQGWLLEFGGKTGGQWFERTVAGLGGFNSGGIHTLSVSARGSSFSFYLDGQHMGSASDDRLSRGSVGLGTNHAITRFHDINVTFPGEDQRDPATRQVDQKLRSLRETVAAASEPLSRVGQVPAAFDPAAHDPASVQVLEESTDPDIQAATAALRANASDPNLAITTETDAQGNPISQTQIDGSTTLYDAEGRPSVRYNRAGQLEVTYTYDAQGDLLETTLLKARQDLADQLAVLRAEVERASADALEELTRKKGLAVEDLVIRVQVTREQLSNQNSAFQDQLHSLEATDVSGKARSMKAQVLDQMRAGLQQIAQAQLDLERQYAEALAGLNSQIADLRTQIQQDTEAAFQQIQNQEETFTRSLIRQEIEPILYREYRRTIGRDPDSAEIAAIVADLYQRFGTLPASLDLEVLRAEIRRLPGYAARAEEVSQIKQQVRAWLKGSDPDASGSDPIRFPPEALAPLGLSPGEVVPLTHADADRILAWLDSRSHHFGHSAFLALKEFLAGQGIEAGPTDLAIQAILIDILVGVITPKVGDDSDLELSLFALSRAAQLHGGVATPAQLGFEDLRSLLATSDQRPATAPLIAHINGNHYILVQSVAEDGTVTYREPNAGPTGETRTMTQEEFNRQWQGTVLSPRAPPHAWQVLSDREAQRITGSFFPLLFAILWNLAVAAFNAAVFVVQTIGTILGNLSHLIANAFGAIGGFFQGLGPIGQFLATPFQGLGGVFHGFNAIFSGQLLTGLKMIGQSLLFAIGVKDMTFAGLAAFAQTTVLATGASMGVSRGLEALGVSPEIASLVGAFAGGFVVGLPTPSAGTAGAGSSAVGATSTASSTHWLHSAAASGLTSTAIEGTSLGLTKAGLDPALASLAGMGVGTITSSMISGVNVPQYEADGITPKIDPNTGKQLTVLEKGFKGLGYTLSTDLVPTVAGELARFGIVKLGESVGLDPRISQIAGITVSTGVSSFTRTGDLAKSTMTAISNGLTRGALQVGLSFATQGLDPLLGSLASATITGAIEGLLSPADPNRPLDPKRKGVFAGIGDTVTRALGGFTEIGLIKPGDPLATAEGLAKLNDFSNIVREQGLGAAVETYATSLLYRSSVESLINAGNSFSIRQNINSQLQNPDNLVDLEGREVIQISLGADALGNKKYLWVDPASHALVASLQGQDYIRYFAPPKVHEQTGTAGIITGTITRSLPDGSQLAIEIRDGQVTEAQLIRDDQTWLFTGNEVGDLQISQQGMISNGLLVDQDTGLSFAFEDGRLTQAGLTASAAENLSTEELAAVADLLQSASPTIFDPTPAQKQQDLADFNTVIEDLRAQIAEKFGTEKAQAIVQDFKQAGQQTIQDPDSQLDQREQLAQHASDVELNETEKLALAKLVTGWANGLREKGVRIAVEGNSGLAQWTGFGVYFLGELVDVGADPLRLGEGTRKAFQEDLPNGRYGAALWHLTEDAFRAFQFIPAVGLTAKAVKASITEVKVSSKVAGSTGVFSRIGNAVDNFLFRFSSKVHNIGKGELALSRKAWEFKSGGSVVKGVARNADEAGEIVYRAVPKGASDPMRFSTAQGRFNSISTEVLYTSKDKNTAVAEFLKHRPGAEYEVYEITLKGSRRITLDALPVEEVSRSLGDTASRAADLGKIVAPSDINGSVNNVVVLRNDLIKEFKKVAP